MTHAKTGPGLTPGTGSDGENKNLEASPTDVHQPLAAISPESAQAIVEGHSHGTVKPGNSDADAPAPSNQLPPAGPHADPKLMSDIATPGTGALTPTGAHDDVDSTSS